MQQKPRSKLLKQAEIRREISLQTRAGINMATVEEYKEALQGGAKFPPVVTFFDGVYYYLADGWHRYEAYVAARVDEIPADVYEGTRRDAQIYALGANAVHGLRRTNEDKRRAVGLMLDDAEWSAWSDREIARHCKVGHQLVSSVRASLDENPVRSRPNAVDSENSAAPVGRDRSRKYVTKHGTESVMKTANIGRGGATVATGPDESAAEQDLPPDDNQAEIDAYVSNLQRDNEALARELESHRATEQGAEIQKLTQMLLNAEAKIASFEEKSKSLRWFGDKFAELRRLLSVKYDRDVLTRVRELVKETA